MKVNDLKDLRSLIQLCRKTGVRTISVDGVSLELGTPPVKQVNYKAQPEELNPFDPGKIPNPILRKSQETKEMTDEDMLLWSALPGGTQIDR